MLYKIMGLILSLGAMTGASAAPHTITIDGPKHRYDCADPSARGPLTGLYRQSNGGYLCVLDYEDLVHIGQPEDSPWWLRYSLAVSGIPELVGRVYVSGWGYHTRVGDGFGRISELTACPFEGPIKMRFIDGGRIILLTRPVFAYDVGCCNLRYMTMEQDRLVRVTP
jgi:hypothetical protein